jgi:aryl-alcohol dehydrogenase-like predicted oxidoreductase
VTQGKVRYIGNSNFSGWQIADADWTASGSTRFVSAQNQFSLLERRVEHEVLPACEHFGLGFLPFFPLGSGLLSGKYRRGEKPPEGTRLAAWGSRGAAALSDKNFEKVEKLEAWAGERGHTILELAFAWLLGHPVVSSVIAGATSAEQVQANAATAAWALTPEEVKEVSDLIS